MVAGCWSVPTHAVAIRFLQCRFPCAKVLDLSRNKLTGVGDDELAGFPKLQVLDLAHNRLRSIQGLRPVLELKALDVSHNTMKNVKNIEHLVQLQVLNVSSNRIVTSSALRLLSLNKMLTHVDLDGNPVVETDERQRRKNIVYLLNLMPMLLSLGSVPCASLSSKEKKTKTATATLHGRALFDTNGQFPYFQALWTTRACALVHCWQDVDLPRKHRSGGNDDDDDDDDDDQVRGTGNWDSADPTTRQLKKPLNGKQQRQKDEQRSRAVGYRSREKAMPSPPKVKTSAFAFGPPLPPPSPKKAPATTARQADPRVVKQQQRRANELSAPKYQPVDTSLLSQEQKRKSRPTFDVNMSVAERLLLAQERAQRRGSSGGVKRSNPTGGGAKRAIAYETESGAKQRQAKLHSEPTTGASPTSRSPETSNNQEVVVAFRIEPLPRSDMIPSRGSVEKPNQVSADAQPETPDKGAGVTLADTPQLRAQPLSPAQRRTAPPLQPDAVKPGKEGTFLQALAVTDFLNHAEEEFSTALTALTVLLTICERETTDDSKKLAEYRSSLEALDILNERESHELYAKIRDYADPSRQAECTEAFERLGTVKRSTRQLLQRLEADAPGSDAIRAFCRSLRTHDLRGILESASDEHCTAGDRRAASGTDCVTSVAAEDHSTPSSMGVASTSADASRTSDDTMASLQHRDAASSSTIDADNALGEETTHSLVTEEVATATTSTIDMSVHSPALSRIVLHETHAEDDEFDFLSSDTCVFDDDDAVSGRVDAECTPPLVESHGVDDDGTRSLSVASSGSAYSMTATDYVVAADITVDIQRDDDATATLDDVESEASVTFEPTDSKDVDELLAADMGIEDTLVVEVADDAWAAVETTPVDGGAAAAADDDSWLPAATSGSEGNSVTAADSAGHGDLMLEQDEEEESDRAGTAELEADAVLDAAEAQADSEQLTEPLGTNECDELESGDAFENQALEEVADAESAVLLDSDRPLSDGEDADDEEAEVFGDWEKGFDPSTNHYFWFNHETGESSWTPPEGWPFEVDTPFEATDEAALEEGDEGGDCHEDTDAETDAREDDDDEEERQGEHRALESPQRPLESEFDDDLFSDQDLPSF